MQLKIDVDGQRLKCTDPYTVKGARNFVECAFTFSADWALLDKWALFKREDGNETYEMEVKENKCIVPTQCLQNAGKFILSVVGRDGNNDIIATAASVFAVVLENDFEVSEENRLTVTYLAEALEIAKKAIQRAADAEKAAERSERAAAGVQEINDELDKFEKSAAEAQQTINGQLKQMQDLAAQSEQNINDLTAANIKKIDDTATAQITAINSIKTEIDSTAQTVAQNKEDAQTAANTATEKAEEASALIDDAFLLKLGLKAIDGSICMDDNKEE